MEVVEFLKYLAKKIGRLLGRKETINRIETRRKIPPPAPQIQPPPKSEPEIKLPPVEILNINDTRAWNQHVQKMSVGLEDLKNFLNANSSTINSRPELKKYADFVRGKLDKMKTYINEKFPAPDMEENPNEELAGKIIKFAKNYILELCNSSYNGLKYTKGGESERKFYRDFLVQLELYLARIGVDRENVKPKDFLSDYSEYFDVTPNDITETSDGSLEGRIAEIEFLPHFVHYYTDDGDDKKYIFGKCKVYKLRR